MLESTVGTIINYIYVLTIIFVIALVILENRSPVKTVAWIFVLVLVPVGGIIAYTFLGQEYRKKKIFSRKGLKSPQRLQILRGKQMDAIQNIEVLNHLDYYPIQSLRIMQMLLTNSNSVVSPKNKMSFLIDGKETFDALTEALENAKKHIHLEFYIFMDDVLGNKIINILCKKAQNGVQIRLLYDDVGSWKLSSKSIKLMKSCGIELHSFQKVYSKAFASRVNYRNHRKLVVIDGLIGFTGGLNIADKYLHGDPELGYWCDTFVRIEGKAVWSIQNIFAADWYFTTKENLSKAMFYPLPQIEGDTTIQIINSGPDSDWPSIAQFYFSVIAQAQKHVYLTSPYFMPPDDIVTALKTSALRGVDVRIIIPKRSDTLISRLSTESYIEEMLEAGVKIYRYVRGFIHSKTIEIDGEIVSVGSANMDFRSLDTNFEINAIIYDQKQASKMIETFNSYLTHCEPFIYKKWKKRPFTRRFLTSLARILSPLL